MYRQLIRTIWLPFCLLSGCYFLLFNFNEFRPTRSTVIKYNYRPLNVPTSASLQDEWKVPTKINENLGSIFKVKDTVPPSLQCQPISYSRYQTLAVSKRPAVRYHIQYFFALDLNQNLDSLPQLLASIIEVATFLGPANCALSIIGQNPVDGTDELLQAMKPSLEVTGIAYTYRSYSADPATRYHAIDLAKLRNLALAPLIYSKRADVSTSVVFINNVPICPDDILELLLQRRKLQAHVTCAMDWTYSGDHALFYNVRTARTISGNLFYDRPPSSRWDLKWSLFSKDATTQRKYEENRPFQVFSCWSSVVAFTAKPFLQGLRFRSPLEAECLRSESELLYKDLWLGGYGRIAVIPTINLGHTIEESTRIKGDKGHVSDLVVEKETGQDMIDWLPVPKHVKCTPGLGRQSSESQLQNIGDEGIAKKAQD